MDDLKKDVYEIWKMRLRIERIRSKLRANEWKVESEEYKKEHGEEAYLRARKEIEATKQELLEIEEDQSRLEDKIKLPNPFIKKYN